MQLLSTNLINKFKAIWKQKNKYDPLLPLKLYDPITQLEWYPLEFGNNRNDFYGFAIINGHWAFGSFDLQTIVSGNKLFNKEGTRVKGIEYDRPQLFSALFGTDSHYSDYPSVTNKKQ